jgi:hypothetical protein
MNPAHNAEYVVPGEGVWVRCAGCDSPDLHRPDALVSYLNGWAWRLTPHRKMNGKVCTYTLGPFTHSDGTGRAAH